jgi:threonine/homoserine/homoserine lactone efflux protein
MAILRMLNRAALICNICFLLAIGLLYLKHPGNPGFESLIIIMGFLLSIVLNIVVNIALFYFRIAKKPVVEIPRMLRILNGGFLVIQLILLIK